MMLISIDTAHSFKVLPVKIHKLVQLMLAGEVGNNLTTLTQSFWEDMILVSFYSASSVDSYPVVPEGVPHSPRGEKKLGTYGIYLHTNKSQILLIK